MLILFISAVALVGLVTMMKLAAENHLLIESRLNVGILPSETFPLELLENLILNPKMKKKKTKKKTRTDCLQESPVGICAWCLYFIYHIDTRLLLKALFKVMQVKLLPNNSSLFTMQPQCQAVFMWWLRLHQTCV